MGERDVLAELRRLAGLRVQGPPGHAAMCSCDRCRAWWLIAEEWDKKKTAAAVLRLVTLMEAAKRVRMEVHTATDHDPNEPLGESDMVCSLCKELAVFDATLATLESVGAAAALDSKEGGER